MPYMLAPGARLVVGPHGQLDETLGGLGSCCKPCATKRPMGALGFLPTATVATSSGPVQISYAQAGQVQQIAQQSGVSPGAVVLAMRAQAAQAAQPGASASAPIGPAGGRRGLIIGGAVAVAAGLGLYMMFKPKRR